MPQKIQRVPRTLQTILSTSGGQTPAELLDQIRATLDLLQLYGLTQWQTRSAADAALVEGGNVTLTVPTNEVWVLFSAAFLIAKTATATALRAGIQLGPDATQMSSVVSEQLGPFGATETGAVRAVFVSPYPRVLPGGSLIRGTLEILGTDANASTVLTASVGVLGG